MNYLEITGFITGVAGVWLTIRQNVWCFPVGLVNVTVSLFLFIDQKLYSDAVQQIFYMFLLSYGWYNWSRLKDDFTLLVTRLSAKEVFLHILIALIIALVMGSFFYVFTDAHLPWPDASATALSFVAQYLIAKKKIENWIFWMVVNLMYIGIYFYKELYLYTGLFAIYLLLAISGWYSWKKSLVAETHQ